MVYTTSSIIYLVLPHPFMVLNNGVSYMVFGITSGQAPLILVPKCDIGNPEVRTTFILQVNAYCSTLIPNCDASIFTHLT